jgi:hypothetical protein
VTARRGWTPTGERMTHVRFVCWGCNRIAVKGLTPADAKLVRLKVLQPQCEWCVRGQVRPPPLSQQKGQ